MWFSSNKRNFSSLTIACENARCDMLNQIHFNATRDMELQHGPCKLWWILAWKMHNFLCWCIAHLSYLYPCSVMSYGRESMIFPACRIWDIFNSVSWTDPLNWGSWIAQILLHEALRLAKNLIFGDISSFERCVSISPWSLFYFSIFWKYIFPFFGNYSTHYNDRVDTKNT